MNREEAMAFLLEDHCGECKTRKHLSDAINLSDCIGKMMDRCCKCEIGQKLMEAMMAYIGNIQDEVEG
jgi:hypothetical protein